MHVVWWKRKTVRERETQTRVITMKMVSRVTGIIELGCNHPLCLMSV